VDGTETAQCDRCDATDWRIAEGSAAHRYIGGSCLYCDQPEPDPNACILTGSLTVYGEASARLELISVDETVSPVLLIVDGDAYSLEASPGEYVLTVSQDGSVSRSYAVTLRAGEIAMDLKLQLQGDITGEGNVNMGDVAKLYAHVKGSSCLTEEYQLLCADYNGNGQINVGDTANLYARIKKG
jgi:hypothetical protein